MKERPILFSGPMVRALLDGSKTQTRRIVKPTGAHHIFQFRGTDDARGADEPTGEWAWGSSESVVSKHIRCPYGKPGDRLYVRETFLYVGPGSGSDLPSYREERADPENHKAANCWFRASQPDETLVWTPSIHMPRWASRITLEVTGVRVERLQDISDVDCIAEGIGLNPSAEGVPMTTPADETMPRGAYRALWDSLAAPGADWDENPWVWVVEFKRVT